MTSWWDRFCFGPVAAERPFLLRGGLLLLFALDVCAEMLRPGMHYGSGGFNVAHFAWLDGILPAIGPATYVGTVIFCASLALFAAVFGNGRLALMALAIGYTASWSMSLLDRYQHHYYLSLALVTLVFFPDVTANDLYPRTTAPEGKKKKADRQAERRRVAAGRNAALAAGGALLIALGVTASGTGLSTSIWLVVFVLAVTGVIQFSQTVREGPQVAAWGYGLFCATTGLVYTYTAIAKMDLPWMSGSTFRQLGGVERLARPLYDGVAWTGISVDWFFSLLATSVIPLELFIATGYFLAPTRDRSNTKWIQRWTTAAWIAALVLHLGAERLDLRIGWFSYYMLATSTIVLMPSRLLRASVTGGLWASQALAHRLHDAPSHTALSAGAGILASLGLFGVGIAVDLPGTATATLLVAIATAATTVLLLARGREESARWAAVATATSALVLWLGVSSSHARFDFYRGYGFDLERQGKLEEALDAYRKAETFAPPGASRRQKIRSLEERLSKAEPSPVLESLPLATAAPKPEQRPNIVLVVADTLRADHLKIYGYEKETAPFLTSLARRAIVFDAAHSTSSWTSPSMASLFTSLYPFQHGVQIASLRAVDRAIELKTMPTTVDVLAEQLRDAGYRTFAVTDNKNVSAPAGFMRGFDRFENLDYEGAPSVNKKLLEWKDDITSEEPYLLYVHYMDPHAPYHERAPWYEEAAESAPPESELEDDALKYDSEIRFLDQHLSELFAAFDWNENTVVVFTSDHGEEFGEHGGAHHGRTLYGEVLNVPLIVQAPGRWTGSRRIDANVSLVDVGPTILEVAGAPASNTFEGHSLVPLLDGRARVPHPIYSHLIYPEDRGLRENEPEIEIQGLTDGSLKLLRTVGGETELFDTAQDPTEVENLSAERPADVARLSDKLDRALQEGTRYVAGSEKLPLTEKQEKKLRALGYLK